MSAATRPPDPWTAAAQRAGSCGCSATWCCGSRRAACGGCRGAPPPPCWPGWRWRPTARSRVRCWLSCCGPAQHPRWGATACASCCRRSSTCSTHPARAARCCWPIGARCGCSRLRCGATPARSKQRCARAGSMRPARCTAASCCPASTTTGSTTSGCAWRRWLSDWAIHGPAAWTSDPRHGRPPASPWLASGGSVPRRRRWPAQWRWACRTTSRRCTARLAC